jgi:hypothetical protein
MNTERIIKSCAFQNNHICHLKLTWILLLMYAVKNAFL